MKPVILSCRVIFSGYHFQKHNKIKPCHFTELFSNVSLPFQLEKKKTIRKQKKNCTRGQAKFSSVHGFERKICAIHRP